MNIDMDMDPAEICSERYETLQLREVCLQKYIKSGLIPPPPRKFVDMEMVPLLACS
jgi:hypothetical protein